jgi:hypothetical protein
VAGGQHHAGIARQRCDAPPFLQRRRQRLLDQQRDAACDHLPGHVQVRARRHGDRHHVDALLIEQPAIVFVPVRRAARDVGDARGIDIGDGRQFHARDLAVDTRMVGAHCAQSNNCRAKCVSHAGMITKRLCERFADCGANLLEIIVRQRGMDR